MIGKEDRVSGEILSEETRLELTDLCERCGLPETVIRTYVEEGLLEAQGEDVSRWRFSEVSLVRVQKARRLERDLRLNPAGAALALELLERIEQLQATIARLRREDD